MRNYGRDREIMRRHERGELHSAIAAVFGISRERVRQIVKRDGGAPRLPRIYAHAAQKKQERQKQREAMRKAKKQRFAAKINMVRNGASIHAITNSVAEAAALRRACAQAGVKSRVRTRVTVNAEQRRRIITQGLNNKRSWEWIAAAVAKAEAKRGLSPVSERAIYMWARNNLPKQKRKR